MPPARCRPKRSQQAKANGVDPVEFVIARDAIAVIVNPENPVSRLTLQQISDIYSGKINNWSEVGGEDRPIVRLSRETNSGTHVYFLRDGHPPGGHRRTRPCFPPTPCCCRPRKASSARCARTRMPSAMTALGYVPADLER